MGWRGGGLGKNGHGIANPITPTVVYASQTFGLGHLAKSKAARKERGRIKREQQVQHKKIQLLEANLIDEKDLAIGHVFTFDHYRNKLLLRILDFVRDSSRIKFKIDVKLTNNERKKIHFLLESFIECDISAYNEMDRQVVEQIMAHNHYMLKTISEGLKAQRRVSIIKTAPQNVYLITPNILRKADDDDNDDVKDQGDVDDDSDGDEETESSIKEEQNQEDIKNFNIINLNKIKIEENGSADDVKVHVEDLVDVKQENDTNTKRLPDLDMTTTQFHGRNESVVIDSEQEKEGYLLRLIDCFHDFVEKPIYKEFRFLGDFNCEESEAIKLFLDICLKKSGFDEKTHLLAVLKHEVLTFNVTEDSNGELFIHKQDSM